jgi:hypothetical protein
VEVRGHLIFQISTIISFGGCRQNFRRQMFLVLMISWNPSASFRSTLFFETSEDYVQERKRIFTTIFGGIDQTYIHERTPNCTLNLFILIYYDDYLWVDEWIASRVLYFGSINQNCMFRSLLLFKIPCTNFSTLHGNSHSYCCAL